MAELLSVCIYTLVIAYTGVGNLCVWAKRHLLAIPNERSSHACPTPSGGGVAIVLTSLFGLLVFAALQPVDPPLQQLSLWSINWQLLLWLTTGGLLVALVSLLDDLYTMSVPVRLGVHCLSALCLIVGVGSVGNLELPLVTTHLNLGPFGIVVTFGWVVSLINAYNFMDGIDGLAGSQAVIAGAAWALLGYGVRAPLVMAFGVVLAASSLGFLGYNWPPARIFMGDVGSAFLGYSFAALPLLATRFFPTPLPPLSLDRLAGVGLLFVWPFLFDSLFTIIRRWSRGENVFHAHRSHLYQRLVITGHSHLAVTLLYAALALLGALLGLGWYWDTSWSGAAIVTALPVMAIGLWLTVRYYEAKPIKVTPALQ